MAEGGDKNRSGLPAWAEFEPLMERRSREELKKVFSRKYLSLGAQLALKGHINPSTRSSAFSVLLKPGETAICWLT